MVGYDELQKLRGLMWEHDIRQRLESDTWPKAHEDTFRKINDICRTEFESYKRLRVDCQSYGDPWTRNNQARAEWLVNQAGRLSIGNAKESAWRMRIENTFLERFWMEVACSECKGRLWRSEIESSGPKSSRIWSQLDQRRLNRTICTCSPAARSQDWLFEDQVEEQIVPQDPAGKIPKQVPDRFIGLRETKNIRQLLDQPPRFRHDSPAQKLRDVIKTSPCKPHANSALFPFLILEAKSDSAQNSFSDIQTQTAFPIWALLNLQKDLQSIRPNDVGRTAPLVWFIAYKGSVWKIYGCYLEPESETGFSYHIHHLRSGDIATKDGALQLLLLVDHIMDWARDILRPSIITQLVSLVTDKAFDKISLAPDSDIASSHERRTDDWITEAASTAAQGVAYGLPKDMPRRPEKQANAFPTLPNTNLGAVRPVSTACIDLNGLRITEGNVDSVLTFCSKPDHRASARKLVNEITRWDEVLVVTGADLDLIEREWADHQAIPADLDEGPSSEYYAVFEYRSYLSVSWEIVRELNYFAVSKSAFETLMKHANLVDHQGIERFATAPRICPDGLIKDAVDCLRSPSPLQVIHSALQSTLFYFSPEPERKRRDHVTAVEYLGLGYQDIPRVKSFIDYYTQLTDRIWPSSKRNVPSVHKRRKKSWREWKERTSNRSFRRISTLVVELSSAANHSASECPRCSRSDVDIYKLRSTVDWPPTPDASGAILVATLQHNPDSKQDRHEIGLLVTQPHPWLKDAIFISTVVDDLAQGFFIYHTIRHTASTYQFINNPDPDVLWNLPCHRPSTWRQRWDIDCWSQELFPEGTRLVRKPIGGTDPWVHQQILLALLRRGVRYKESLRAFTAFRDRFHSDSAVNGEKRRDDRSLLHSFRWHEEQESAKEMEPFGPFLLPAKLWIRGKQQEMYSGK